MPQLLQGDSLEVKIILNLAGTPMGADIQQHILPLLQKVAEQVPISMSNPFLPAMQTEYNILQSVLRCTDLASMDDLFACINKLWGTFLRSEKYTHLIALQRL